MTCLIQERNFLNYTKNVVCMCPLFHLHRELIHVDNTNIYFRFLHLEKSVYEMATKSQNIHTVKMQLVRQTKDLERRLCNNEVYCLQ